MKRMLVVLLAVVAATLVTAQQAAAIPQSRAKQIHSGFVRWEGGAHNPPFHQLFNPTCTSHSGKIQWVCQSVVAMDGTGAWYYVETAISPTGWILHNWLGPVPISQNLR